MQKKICHLHHFQMIIMKRNKSFLVEFFLLKSIEYIFIWAIGICSFKHILRIKMNVYMKLTI
jgi:hypothetical protein